MAIINKYTDYKRMKDDRNLTISIVDDNPVLTIKRYDRETGAEVESKTQGISLSRLQEDKIILAVEVIALDELLVDIGKL